MPLPEIDFETKSNPNALSPVYPNEEMIRRILAGIIANTMLIVPNLVMREN
jgi:hypothetical protein